MKHWDERTKKMEPDRSPLAEIPGIGMVTSFPIESMHEVYLGVGKFLLRSITGDRGKKDGVKRTKTSSTTENLDDGHNPMAFIGNANVRIMDRRIIIVSKFRPKELARDVRSLDDVSEIIPIQSIKNNIFIQMICFLKFSK